MANVFLKPNHPLLRKISKEIPVSKISSKEIQAIIQKMLKIAYGEQKNPKIPVIVGLAAPQIGISKRIILVDLAADGKGKMGNLKIFINPEIIWYSKSEKEWYEGCYSTGKICGIVSRSTSIKSTSIKIQALKITPQGCNREIRKYTDYIARIFQHEIDHLNGKVFIERIKDPDKLHKVTKREFPLYRKNWRNWPKKYPLPLALGKLKKV